MHLCSQWPQPRPHLHDLQPLGDVLVHLLQFGPGGLSLHLQLCGGVELTQPPTVHLTLQVRGEAG